MIDHFNLAITANVFQAMCAGADIQAQLGHRYGLEETSKIMVHPDLVTRDEAAHYWTHSAGARRPLLSQLWEADPLSERFQI